MENKESYDIFPALTFGAGFFAGVKETSGVDLSLSAEFFTKYAPTMFAIFINSEFPNFLGNLSRRARKGLENGSLNLAHTNPKTGKKETKNYSEADFNKQVKASAAVNKLERTAEEVQENNVEKTLYSGLYTANLSLLGYWLGSATSMIRYINS